VTDEPGNWAALLHWVLGNPEKGALFLVLLAGAWRWLRELRKEVSEDKQHESFTDMLIRENKLRMQENKELRNELRELRSNGRRADESNE